MRNVERILFQTLTKKDQEQSRKISIDFELKSCQILLGAKAREDMNCMEL